jgi:hypothetical protein
MRPVRNGPRWPGGTACHSRTLGLQRHRATPEHRYRRDVVVPDPPIGIIICEPRRLDEPAAEDSMLKNNKNYSKEARSEILQAGV